MIDMNEDGDSVLVGRVTRDWRSGKLHLMSDVRRKGQQHWGICGGHVWWTKRIDTAALTDLEELGYLCLRCLGYASVGRDYAQECEAARK